MRKIRVEKSYHRSVVSLIETKYRCTELVKFFSMSDRLADRQKGV